MTSESEKVYNTGGYVSYFNRFAEKTTRPVAAVRKVKNLLTVRDRTLLNMNLEKSELSFTNESHLAQREDLDPPQEIRYYLSTCTIDRSV